MTLCMILDEVPSTSLPITRSSALHHHGNMQV